MALPMQGGERLLRQPGAAGTSRPRDDDRTWPVTAERGQERLQRVIPVDERTRPGGRLGVVFVVSPPAGNAVAAGRRHHLPLSTLTGSAAMRNRIE
ncbi:hypothetical protein [Geodermatophilus chilensis]|uniref:hypothetical protein n=1 Tax=Geodermatophilus chilensis TaxID=2035835 RepID=UPI001E394888|nr:hypothetical protein [Geodermatophilus chilensis]